MSDLVADYCARMLLEWLSQRFETRLSLSRAEGDAFVAADGDHSVGVYIAPLWEHEAAGEWEETLRATGERLLAGDDGSYLMWLPPRAGVPAEEPAATDFVERVQAVAASTAPGTRAEVTFPVTVKLGKMRDEGGYASVIGGLSRWWTRITENVNGTYHVDSSAVHRLTSDGEAREKLWSDIGALALSVELGQSAEFEVDEAWTLQRLPDSEGTAPGFALVGAPPSVDPTDGILVRRVVRKRLAAANEALDALDVELRAVGLIGSYEYGELETAGATVKAVSPALFNRLEVVCVLADGEVRPTFLPRALPWA